MENYCLKNEFRRRLCRLYRELNEFLREDSLLDFKLHPSFLPALFSVYTFMWCKRWGDLIKRV